MPYANINLEGRLVNDPEFKVGKENREFCTFRVAVNQNFGAQEVASFFTVTANEVLAARIRKAGLSKGRMIHASGNLTLRDYTTREGEHRTSADVGLLDWHFTGSKPKTDEEGAPSTKGSTVANNATGTLHEEQYVSDPDDLPI